MGHVREKGTSQHDNARIMSVKEESYLDGFFMRFLSVVENGQYLLFLGQGHRQVKEGVKGDGHLEKTKVG